MNLLGNLSKGYGPIHSYFHLLPVYKPELENEEAALETLLSASLKVDVSLGKELDELGFHSFEPLAMEERDSLDELSHTLLRILESGKVPLLLVGRPSLCQCTLEACVRSGKRPGQWHYSTDPRVRSVVEEVLIGEHTVPLVRFGDKKKLLSDVLDFIQSDTNEWVFTLELFEGRLPKRSDLESAMQALGKRHIVALEVLLDMSYLSSEEHALKTSRFLLDLLDLCAEHMQKNRVEVELF